MTHHEAASQTDVHMHNRPNYLLVFIGLALLTVIEVGISYLPQVVPTFPHIVVVVSLMAFMAFKVLLVAMFYMHLRMDSKWFSYLFLIPLPFVVLILFALLLGYPGVSPQ